MALLDGQLADLAFQGLLPQFKEKLGGRSSPISLTYNIVPRFRKVESEK